MRTTVTFDPDVYARLSRLRQQCEIKPFINEVLRLGLEELERRDRAPVVNAPLPVFHAKPRILDVDNVHRLLDELDSERAVV